MGQGKKHTCNENKERGNRRGAVGLLGRHVSQQGQESKSKALMRDGLVCRPPSEFKGEKEDVPATPLGDPTRSPAVEGLRPAQVCGSRRTLATAFCFLLWFCFGCRALRRCSNWGR